MAIVTYKKNNSISSKLTKISNDNGFSSITSNSFMGQIILAIRDQFEEELNLVYDVGSNIDIGRSKGEYLDRWGRILGEPRDTISYALDLSLSNVYINLSDGITAGSITTDGSGIIIPKSIPVYASLTGQTVQLIDNVYIAPSENGAYARVIATSPGELYIPSNSIDEIGFTLRDVNNVTNANATRYSFEVTNNFDIEGGQNSADDSLYKYILTERTKSIGLYNQSKINTLMDMPQIVNIYTNMIDGGIYIYIDATNYEILDSLVEVARSVIKSEWIRGYPISVYPPILRKVSMKLRINLIEPDISLVSQTELMNKLVYDITNTKMGEAIDFKSMIMVAADELPNVRNVSIRNIKYNSKELARGAITQQFNERAIISPIDIEIV